jgi:signal peptidase II
VWNPGISFGMLADGGDVMRYLLTALALAVAGWLIWKVPQFQRLERLGAGLIAGGAIGNAIDRLRFGKVVDFIDVYVQTWHWPAFNIADAAITIGAGLWICSILVERETDSS